MHALDHHDWLAPDWRPGGSARRATLVAVLVLHLAGAYAWWQLPPVTIAAVTPPRVLAAILPAAAPARPPEPKPIERPRPAPPKPHVAQPAAATPAEATPVLAPLAQSTPPAAAAPALAATAAIVTAAVAPAPAPVAPPPPPPVVPPRFDAAYLDNAPPVYPSLAKQFREQGVVMLNVRVTAAGLPDTVEVRVSSGSARLDDAARTAVSHWKFIPARQGDLPVSAWVVVPVRFSLT